MLRTVQYRIVQTVHVVQYPMASRLRRRYGQAHFGSSLVPPSCPVTQLPSTEHGARSAERGARRNLSATTGPLSLAAVDSLFTRLDVGAAGRQLRALLAHNDFISSGASRLRALLYGIYCEQPCGSIPFWDPPQAHRGVSDTSQNDLPSPSIDWVLPSQPGPRPVDRWARWGCGSQLGPTPAASQPFCACWARLFRVGG